MMNRKTLLLVSVAHFKNILIYLFLLVCFLKRDIIIITLQSNLSD